MHLKKILCVSLLALPISLLSGCNQETEQDLLSEAQYCLDGATTAVAAQACVSSISGIDSKTANILKCSAGYIGQGFGNPAKLVDAFDKIKNSTSGGAGAPTSTEMFLSIMSFDSKAVADTTFNYCIASGLKGLSLLAAMTRAATNVANLIPGGLDPSSPTFAQDLHDAAADIIANIGSDPTSAAAATTVGETVQSIYTVACKTGTPANDDLCGQLDDAYASLPPGSTAEDIGKAILQAWQAGS